MSRSLKVGWGSLAVSIVVLGLKASAYWVTGSVALYSDALETVINVVAAVGALVALWLSEQPANANHYLRAQLRPSNSAPWLRARYVLATALAIGREAWLGWEQHPRRTP